MPSENPENIPLNKKPQSIFPRYALIVSLLLVNCSKQDIPKKATPERAKVETTTPGMRDLLFADVLGTSFDADIRRKIALLKNEFPSFQKISQLVQDDSKFSYTFVDAQGIIAFQKDAGIPEEITLQQVQHAGAMTTISEKGTVIYISEYAMRSKALFCEGVSNEFFNIYFQELLPTTLVKKRRVLDAQGGYSFTQQEIEGLGKETMKEFMSGFLGSVLAEKNKGIHMDYSLRSIRKNLENGLYHHSNPPGYAFEYTYGMLRDYGFPPPPPQQLILLHQNLTGTAWESTQENLIGFCKYFGISLRE